MYFSPTSGWSFTENSELWSQHHDHRLKFLSLVDIYWNTGILRDTSAQLWRELQMDGVFVKQLNMWNKSDTQFMFKSVKMLWTELTFVSSEMSLIVNHLFDPIIFHLLFQSFVCGGLMLTDILSVFNWFITIQNCWNHTQIHLHGHCIITIY